MTITAYPNGVSSWGVPLLGPGGDLPVSGNYLFVSSTTGANGNSGSFDSPKATIDSAIGSCVANQGWVIICLPGHAETIIAASGITMDVAGVTVTSLGNGADRAEITFSTATSASVVISAANCAWTNMVGIGAIDALTNPIHVQASDFTLDMEWRDTSASVEAARAVLTTAAADRLNITLNYLGFTAGNAVVNAIRLVGVNDATINVRFYGISSTSVVEFLTTACTNVSVTAWTYNSGITNGTRNVVDTATGSTWYATITDAAAGAVYSGGSGAALAVDDVATIAANQTVPSADSTANVLERDVVGNKTDAAVTVTTTDKSLMAYAKGGLNLQVVPALDATTNTTARDVIGNKTDAGVQAIAADKSLVGYIKGIVDMLAGTAGVVTYPAAVAAANAVNIAEVLRYVQDQAAFTAMNRNMTNYFAVTADMTSATWNTVAAHEIITVTGAVRIRIVPQCGATLTSGGGTATLILGDETTTDSLIASSDAENFATGETWFDTTMTRTVAIASIYEKLDFVVMAGKDIGYTIGTEALTGGNIIFHCFWVPLDATGACAAGAGGPL